MPPRKCKSKVRQGGKHVPCGTTIKGERCPNRENHLYKLKTGYCSNGWCEGTKATTYRGDPAPTCKFFTNCPCKCHDDISMMFEMSGMERKLVEHSEYVHPERTFWMPSDDDVRPSNDRSIPDGSPTPTPLESPAPGILPPTTARSYGTTATGRAARGQLEAWVNEQCDIWLVEKYLWPCTPVWISEQIGKEQGIDPPSVGAINAVFNRWTDLGFAVIERKPVRFTGYTEKGLEVGLEGLKEKARRQKKLRSAELRRGTVR